MVLERFFNVQSLCLLTLEEPFYSFPPFSLSTATGTSVKFASQSIMSGPICRHISGMKSQYAERILNKIAITFNKTSAG